MCIRDRPNTTRSCIAKSNISRLIKISEFSFNAWKITISVKLSNETSAIKSRYPMRFSWFQARQKLTSAHYDRIGPISYAKWVMRQVDCKNSWKTIRRNRPFSLVDFVFPMQVMWRYLGGLNLCYIHYKDCVRAWKCPTLKENTLQGIVAWSVSGTQNRQRKRTIIITKAVPMFLSFTLSCDD